MELKTYHEITTAIWKIFKKYQPEGVSIEGFTDDVHELDEKYRNTDVYHFMQKLLKVYFDELNRRKG